MQLKLKDEILNNKKKVVELGYFIAKIRNDNMQFLLNRFNEKYKQEKKLNIRFFNEEPLTVKRARYNQGGTVCYCMKNEKQGKQKVSNVWKTINCSENCKYRVSADEVSKPMCNFEGTLKFLLPEISTDRIWLMKIKGQTSIERLETYIGLQKQIGNSLIGDYTLFLEQVEQTNKLGKKFKNYVLDIVKKEDFISTEIIPSNQTQLSTDNTQNVNNSADKLSENVVNNQKEEKKLNETENTEKEVKNTKKKTTKKATEKEAKTIEETKNNFENHFILVETYTKNLKKEGKPTEYLIGNFVDMQDKPLDVIIPPKFKEELLQCDVGTTVILDLATIGDKTFTNNIQYVQKCLKNVAA